MAKRIITISREYGSWESNIMTRISSERLQNSQDFRRNIFRKTQNYLPRKDYLPMLFRVVISQEDQ